MDDDISKLSKELKDVEIKFKRACDQVLLLNDKLEATQQRYEKAKEDNVRAFRYNLRMKIATVEGVRNAYYEYACEKAEEIADLRFELWATSLQDSDDDSDDDMLTSDDDLYSSDDDDYEDEAMES